MRRVSAALFAALIVVGCSSSKNGAQTASSPAAAPTNETGFPLYDGSVALASKDWQVVRNGRTYTGTEVIAKTPASLPQLSQWLHALGANPPSGYAIASSDSHIEAARKRANDFGVDFQAFSRQQDGKPHGVIVVAIDPQTFDARAGTVLGMVDKYTMLPQAMRDAIDAQSKARTGYSVSEMLNPDTPIGAALSAVKELRDSGDRGVVVVDGAKP